MQDCLLLEMWSKNIYSWNNELHNKILICWEKEVSALDCLLHLYLLNELPVSQLLFPMRIWSDNFSKYVWNPWASWGKLSFPIFSVFPWEESKPAERAIKENAQTNTAYLTVCSPLWCRFHLQKMQNKSLLSGIFAAISHDVISYSSYSISIFSQFLCLFVLLLANNVCNSHYQELFRW